MSDLSILPRNAQPFEKAVDEAVALAVAVLETPVRQAWDAETIRLDVLPWLAWGVGRRTWNASWPEAVQREVVRDAIPIARRTGTVQSVRAVMATVGVSQTYGGDLAVTEWFQSEPKGEPFTFSVGFNLNPAAGPAPSAAFVEELIDEVSQVKPARAHFTLRQTLRLSGGATVAGAVRPATYTRLDLAQRTPCVLTVTDADGNPVVDGGGVQIVMEL